MLIAEYAPAPAPNMVAMNLHATTTIFFQFSFIVNQY